MEHRLRKAVGILAACALTGSVCAQQDLIIGNIDIPSFRWGRQTATFEVTNNSDWVKYITVETEIQFEGTYLDPVRKVHTSYPLASGETRTLTPEIDIPGNYGKASLYIRLYDVVDTLDDILAGQKVFEQPFHLTFHIPPEIQPYFQEKIVLPPMVDNNPVWDNEFAHLLPVLLVEGKSLPEIAALMNADTGFVKGVAEELRRNGSLYKNKDSTFTPLFPVFLVGQAEATKRLVEQASDRMAALIQNNFKDYDAVLDSLVRADALTTDSNDFLDGGTVLYRRYPMVAGLLLWYHLGQVFITGRTPLSIFDQTDPCRARIGKYMYAVQGGDVFQGRHYYNLRRTGTGLEILYGDTLPRLRCPSGAGAREAARGRPDYQYTPELTPEPFLVSAGVVAPALVALSKGVDDVFLSIRDTLTSVSSDHGHETVTVGERYWFWNQLTTRTIDKLVKNGVLQRRGNGQFRFTVSE